MNAINLMGTLLTSPASGPLLGASNWLLYRDHLRQPLVRALDRRLAAHRPPGQARHPSWQAIDRQRTLIYTAVLHTLDRVIGQRLLAPHVARTIAHLWGSALTSVAGSPAVQRFRAEHGHDPPWFLVLAPGYACNLHCPGCYASSTATRDTELGAARTSGSAAAHYRLPWSTLDRVLTEAKELWSVPLFVISGGEPLLYRSQGKDLLDLVEKHHDSLFLMFTNGTLVDHTLAARLHRLGNLTPAISVEGLRQTTDQRRGAGMFDRVLAAMAHLRSAGVPFGLSATVTRANCEEILSDPFLDFFFVGQGAFYGFLFQYTPIGRTADINLVPTPRQSAAFFRRTWEVIARKHLFLLDFANHGPLVEGCISAGRDRGYFYIDWSGKVMPCVFAPYSASNIHDVYARGGTLDDVWASPFFRAVRNWQREYGFGHPQLTADTNWLRPCPFRDHHPQFRQWIDKYQLEPEDAAARDALADPAYYQALVACSARHATIAQHLWETEYLNPE